MAAFEAALAGHEPKLVAVLSGLPASWGLTGRALDAASYGAWDALVQQMTGPDRVAVSVSLAAFESGAASEARHQRLNGLPPMSSAPALRHWRESSEAANPSP